MIKAAGNIELCELLDVEPKAQCKVCLITSTSSRTRSNKKCKKNHFLGIHDRVIHDEMFRKNMIDLGRSEDICREMDKLANEDHTRHITPEEISVYRDNLWIRSKFVGSDTMPERHRADFN